MKKLDIEAAKTGDKVFLQDGREVFGFQEVKNHVGAPVCIGWMEDGRLVSFTRDEAYTAPRKLYFNGGDAYYDRDTASRTNPGFNVYEVEA